MMRLKIRKTKSGTYYIPSLSIKQLQKLSKKQKRRWTLSKNGENLILEGARAQEMIERLID